MWIAKTPKRFDFCGCPPCPLCFDFVDGEKTSQGMDKFIQDILGKSTPTATLEEIQTLEKSAEVIHAANLTRDVRIAEELREADHAQHFQRQMGEALQLTKAQALRPKPLNTVVLDGKDLSYVEKEQARKEQQKEKAVREMEVGVINNDLWAFPPPDFARMMKEQRRQMEYEMQKAVYYGSGPTYGVSSIFGDSSMVSTNSNGGPPTSSDMERREQQAKEDAKARMKLEARQPVRR